MRDLFSELKEHFHVEPDRRGFCHATCPFCGSEYDKRNAKIHFSFSTKGFNCFVCEEKGGLVKLAKQVGLWTEGYDSTHFPQINNPRPAPPPEPDPAWLSEPERYIQTYERNPQAVMQWQAYKPLTAETIHKHHFGLGQLPSDYTPNHQPVRLIVPIYRKGRCIGLRGRLLAGSVEGIGPKWMSAKGSHMSPWNLDNLRRQEDTLWIMENFADAALLMQRFSRWTALAMGTAATISPEDIQVIAASRPQQVIVAFDNDLVGQAQGEFRHQLEQEWLAEMREKHPDRVDRMHPPEARGPILVDDLRRAGLRADLFEWPQDAPPKADIGWLLEKEMKEAA